MSLAGELAVADGVNTSVETVQTSRSRAPGHRLAAQPKRSELGKRNHPMLSRGEFSEPSIQWGSLNLVNSWLTNFRDPRHAPRGCQMQARLWVTSVTRR
jgi:hypothetical protein